MKMKHTSAPNLVPGDVDPDVSDLVFFDEPSKLVDESKLIRTVCSEHDEQGEVVPCKKRHESEIAWFGPWNSMLVETCAVCHVKVIEHAVREVLLSEAS